MDYKKKLTPVKAIRAKCLDCCCVSSRDVKLCSVPECTLFPYRFGKNPARKGTKPPQVKPFFEKRAPAKSVFSEESQEVRG